MFLVETSCCRQSMENTACGVASSYQPLLIP